MDFALGSGCGRAIGGVGAQWRSRSCHASPASQFRMASALYKLTASTSFTGSTEAYLTIRNTYPPGDIKGRGIKAGFCFNFGKLGRQHDDLASARRPR
jgi:hypothetical protein